MCYTLKSYFHLSGVDFTRLGFFSISNKPNNTKKLNLVNNSHLTELHKFLRVHQHGTDLHRKENVDFTPIIKLCEATALDKGPLFVCTEARQKCMKSLGILKALSAVSNTSVFPFLSNLVCCFSSQGRFLTHTDRVRGNFHSK